MKFVLRLGCRWFIGSSLQDNDILKWFIFFTNVLNAALFSKKMQIWNKSNISKIKPLFFTSNFL